MGILRTTPYNDGGICSLCLCEGAKVQPIQTVVLPLYMCIFESQGATYVDGDTFNVYLYLGAKVNCTMTMVLYQ